MRLLVGGALVALLLAAAGCGNSGSEATGQNASREETVQADADWTALKRKAGTYSNQLLIPKGPAPDEVVIRDLKKGSGAPIRSGDVFAVHYVDFDYEDGDLLEENWDDQPWRLTWQIGELVKGWEPGLKGVRAGGIRELIVPSRLAYGNSARVYVLEIAYLERH